MFNKKYFFPAYVFLAIIISSGCGSSSSELEQYTTSVWSQMQTMMDVLNQGLYDKFMQNYVDPSYLTSKGGLDQSVMLFDKEEQIALYNALRISKNIQPLYNKSKSELVFISPALTKPVIFRQITGKWYLTGDWFQNQ